MKHLFLLVLLTCCAFYCSFSQGGKPFFTATYEGGMITHPGAGVSAGTELFAHGKIHLDVGVKAAFYSHKNYRTAVYLLPFASLWLKNEDKLWYGVNYGFGIQRTFIPHSYTVNESGGAERLRFAGTISRLSGVGILLSGRTKYDGCRWVINPQLLQNPSGISKKEKYFVLGMGIIKSIQ
jgi:hypothetical protein